MILYHISLLDYLVSFSLLLPFFFEVFFFSLRFRPVIPALQTSA